MVPLTLLNGVTNNDNFFLDFILNDDHGAMIMRGFMAFEEEKVRFIP